MFNLIVDTIEIMNILILSWRGPGHPQAGGAELVSHTYAKAWVKHGHQVTLFTSIYPNAKEEETVDGVKIIRRGNQILAVQLEAFFWYLFDQHQSFNLVVDEFHGLPFFTPLYVRAKKLGFIHEVAKEVWKLNALSKPYNLIPAWLGPIVEPWFFNLYKNIPFLTVSESTEFDLIDWGIPKEHITIIHNGIDVLNNISNFNKKRALIYLGALSQDKGIQVALEVFRKLEKVVPEYQYWVVGKGEFNLLTNLKKKVKSWGLSKKIKFFGFVDEKTKFKLLKQAYLLINPSIREGWGLVVMEAASAGTPTVGFNSPGLRDSIQDGKTGILTKTNTSESIYQETINLIKNESLYEVMSHKATLWSKKFSWADSIEKSEQLIERLAG